ncbi:NAD(P)H-hydrate dehydratase [Thermosipho ferrireducens]|uniref:Bifunctional NAD(P)H-hydrate repair enzyme n=1 Tax=Thermosipho ferrireducens TaxID=2571116 RepID=A0ABX7S5A8_9BACT|nr:NAD(P)H-hydrate dehydratase [Thermosipho ferrireducens]QTA37707.1 NAD(P)H-hydrate dehydratase [Thermosipho ferrireducens]
MRVVTASEMKKLDEKTIKNIGIPSLVLMERAGISVVEALWRELGNLSNQSFLIICGKGNNGGDGLVIARELLNFTEAVKVLLFDSSEKLSDDNRKNLELFKNVGGEVMYIQNMNYDDIAQLIENYDVVVDAIFGTGLSKPVTSPYNEIIDLVNLYSKYTVSVDLPSGISADTGKILGAAVKADLTVTFEFPKVGHILFPGRKLTGKLKIAKIGIPRALQDILPSDRFLITPNTIKIPERLRESNKGTFGKVIIVGGSPNYIGAPLLSALGAIRAGAGLVYLFGPEKVVYNAVQFEPGIIACPFNDNYLTEKAFDYLLRFVDKKTVIVLGPGLGREKETEDFVKKVLQNLSVPMVIDADGLYHLSNFKDILGSKQNIVLTPHPGELARFENLSVEKVKYNYILAEEIAIKYHTILALKDVTTIITNGKNVYFNITGNTSLSKGGSGDILSGLIAGFISQGGSLLDSTIAASYILGRAAELYDFEGRNKITEILDLIPQAIREVVS